MTGRGVAPTSLVRAHELRTPVFLLAGRSPNEQIAYAPLRRLAFAVNTSGALLIESLGAGGPAAPVPAEAQPFLQSLVHLGLFEALDDEPVAMRHALPDAYEPTTVTLFLTGACNLRCTYCYARGGERGTVMPWEIAEAALDFVLRNAARTQLPGISVIFHGGGEPTLAWPVMRRAIEFVEQRCAETGLAHRIEAGLNGIVSPARLRWLAPRLANATISIDGPPDIHDVQRPLNSRGGATRAATLAAGAVDATASGRLTSSAIVRRTLAILDELNAPYGVRSTITGRSVHRLPEVVEYICTVSRATVIQMEPVFPSGRGEDRADEAVDPESFVRGFLAARIIARNHGRRLTFAGARADTLTNRFCEAAAGAFNVTEDGHVTSCYEVSDQADARYGHFAIGGYDRTTGAFGVDLDRVHAASTWTAMEKAPCQSCFAKYHCGGDCPAKVAATGDPSASVDETRCYVIRELTRAQVFSMYGLGDVTVPSMPCQPTSRGRVAPGSLLQIRRTREFAPRA